MKTQENVLFEGYSTNTYYKMKIKLLITMCLIFFSITLYAQKNFVKYHHIIEMNKVNSGYYRLVYNNGSDHILYGATPDPNFQICSDLKAIVTLTSSRVDVDILSFIGTSASAPCINNTTSLGTSYFKLDVARANLGTPTYLIKIPLRVSVWSVATVPFRYRFETDSSFSTVSTNLSASVSRGWSICGNSILSHRGINHYYILVGPFGGVSGVDLKKSTVKNPSTWSGDRTNIAASYGINFTFARNNLGLVISIGADHAFGSKNTSWSYQDHPWIGLGVNTSLGIF